MTFKTFLKELSTIKGWKITGAGIRFRGKDGFPRCPISAVVEKLGGEQREAFTGPLLQGATFLKLGKKLAAKIVKAADRSELPVPDGNIRRQILKACGLN